ncbi:aldolase [Pseudoclavibacter sp. RFBJ3]|nr:aldolase [Pseudoclavibacter sp. RFBJ5]PPF95462.1 aldolase [Pseudoclavibacter sp. RFBJ3]PPF95938.1 aldolase [Pseudoclavibacter sp. RFBH5]PPG21230.1 aldolase [Pseudoclavibacter sp. RFBI4]
MARTMSALFEGHSVVPLSTPSTQAQAEALADGLVAGGIGIVEIALRGDGALDALRHIAGRPDLIVGAGTVLDTEQAKQALDAGAQFLVSPGLSAEVVRVAQHADVPILPGTLTPSDITAARDLGLSQLKLFPAGNFGGLSLLSTYASVFRGITFMPSGGISIANLAEHLEHPAVFAASGSWLGSSKLLDEGADAVAEAARAAADIATRVSAAKVGRT